MGQINTTKTLPAAPEKVWAKIADVTSWEQWLTIHAGWLEAPPAEITVGARLIEKVVMLGMANKLEWTVDTIVPETQLTISGTGMAGVKALFEFNVAPSGDGETEVVINANFSGSLVVGALAKAVEKDALKNLDDSLDKLAALA
ncbi:type II toxin-antitoxin system Rv0910 family toxin [Nocardioides sp. LML1-1-1.1]|uniref:type II toxin-antitoxin system Rv0910 family toxin n=1 Tax=Nocardioides sp. LML1-1-1.1 TaxID=3135248 RepID=UPI003428C9DE